MIESLRTASFKHDELNLFDATEDRRAEMTANVKQTVALNQAFKCAKVDTRCVELIVSHDPGQGQFQLLSMGKVAVQPGSVQINSSPHSKVHST